MAIQAYDWFQESLWSQQKYAEDQDYWIKHFNSCSVLFLL